MTNRIFAGVVFLFSLIIYILTMAPTTSFWDCGEFIASSFTLGVPHPPGTPLYLLIGNVFSTIFFFIDDVGARVNLISPIVSALSVALVYLITVQLIKKWFNSYNNKYTQISIYCSASIGALIFAFTDAQWFNAVESEVYGMSTFFTAIVVWLALKWTESRGENGNIRYILLIAYLMGLAIGVHLLNLLAIPFIGLIIYFSASKDNISGFLIDNFLAYILTLISFIGFDILFSSTLASIVLTFIVFILSLGIKYFVETVIFKNTPNLKIFLRFLARISILPLCGFIFYIINNGIIRGLPHMIKYWSYSDRANLTQYESFSLFIFPLSLVIILITGIIAYTILEVSKKIDLKNSFIYNFFKISIISLLMIYIGFSTYSMIFIRAGQNPNINENDPSDKESFVKYMNREQYGVDHNNIDWFNILKYHLSNDGNETVFSEKFDRPLQEEIKINSSFSGLDGSDNKQRWLSEDFQYYINENTGTFDLDKVSNDDILRFVKNYQINEMYLRYFGWQFIGKEYDKEKYTWSRSDSFKNKRILPLQDNSNLGNIDWFRYGLPFAFIFGMIGMIYHFVRDPKRALSILILFLATGIAIVLYLNQHDPQPRERDYSYVGSFFAFSIWIGIGCMSFFDFINYIFSAIKKDTANKSKSLILIPTVSIFLILLAVPLTYLIKDYSVHDRSGNYSAKDYGYNILAGCKSDSVIFTNGDNDTFPLWYSQEVVKEHKDVRVINLSLLNASWYIKQLYNNNAPGTIKFDFNEPIISEKEYFQILNKGKELGIAGHVHVFINNNNEYYIDINGNKQYDTYDEIETLKIINNLEDPITATIYAYKRWDPAAWASIETSYFYYEIQSALINPERFNILNLIYGKNYDEIINLIDQESRNAINNQQELFRYKFSNHIQFALSIMDINQNGIIDYNEKQLSEYLDQFVQTGFGAFEENPKEFSRWGMSPDNITGKNYPFYYLETPTLTFSNDEMNIYNLKNNPTIQGVAFRVQDVMILKIIEDLSNTNRSIYFSTTVSPSSQMNLNKNRTDKSGSILKDQLGYPINYFVNQGMVLELSSDINYQTQLMQGCDTKILHKNLTEVYEFRNLNNPNVYYSPDNKRILQNYRILFLTLAELTDCIYEPFNDLNNNNKWDMGEPFDDINGSGYRENCIMDLMDQKMPDTIIKHDPNRPAIKLWAAQNYQKTKMLDRANRLSTELTANIKTLISRIPKDRRSWEDDTLDEFLKNLSTNLETISLLNSLGKYEKSLKLNTDLFQIYYSGVYGDNNTISNFIDTVNKKIDLNLDKTLSAKDKNIAINDLIIQEIYNYSISFQDDEYVQAFIAILRDTFVEKYKNLVF